MSTAQATTLSPDKFSLSERAVMCIALNRKGNGGLEASLRTLAFFTVDYAKDCLEKAVADVDLLTGLGNEIAIKLLTKL